MAVTRLSLVAEFDDLVRSRNVLSSPVERGNYSIKIWDIFMQMCYTILQLIICDLMVTVGEHVLILAYYIRHLPVVIGLL